MGPPVPVSPRSVNPRLGHGANLCPLTASGRRIAVPVAPGRSLPLGYSCVSARGPRGRRPAGARRRPARPGADPALVAVVRIGRSPRSPGVQAGDRMAATLIHLPILAAVFLCSPVVAPLLAGTLAAIDSRAFGRHVVMASAGAYALAAAAAVGAFHAGLGAGLADRPRRPRLVRRRVPRGRRFFLVNHSCERDDRPQTTRIRCATRGGAPAADGGRRPDRLHDPDRVREPGGGRSGQPLKIVAAGIAASPSPCSSA